MRSSILHLAIIIITASLAVSFGISFFFKILYRKSGYPKTHRVVVIVGLFFLIVGLILVPLFSNQLASKLELKSWSSIDGIILSSKVIGDRAFRPDIDYRYIVNGDTLFGKSFFNQPGFGGRMNRLDSAEKTVQKYAPGTPVRVYYNPSNTAESTLSPGPTYTHFLRLGLVVCVLLSGSIIVMICLWQPAYNKHLER